MNDVQSRIFATLKTLAMRDGQALLDGSHPPDITAFVTRSRETVAEMAIPVAGLVAVIEGRKEILTAGEQLVYEAGEAFVVPAGARFDVVNVPDAQSGIYRALFIRFPRELVIEAARRWPQLAGGSARLSRFAIGPDLCSAILHAAEALSRHVQTSRRVIDHRILEILLILAEQGLLPLVPKYVEGSVAEAVRLLVRHRLHAAWNAAAVAGELSLSEATLRRRLRQEGHSLQTLLRAERMKAAHTILHDRDADVADALAATGYRSRSHFSRHFHDAFGMTPSAARPKGDKKYNAGSQRA